MDVDADPESLSCSHCGHVVIHGDFPAPLSPVPHLLNTMGMPPSVIERQAIQNTISSTENGVYAIQEEIDKVERVLASLVHQLDALGQHIRIHTNLLSPLQGLPLEILSEIFLHYANDHDEAVDLAQVAMLVSQVCRNWRTAALATPKLWSTIVLPINHSIPTAQFNLTSTFLHRSGASPLSLYITGTQADRREPIFHAVPVADACHRWKHVNCDLQLFQYDNVIRRAIVFLPLLKSLTLSNQHHTQRPAWGGYVFPSMPKLCSVIMLQGMVPDLLRLPWYQLVRLELPIVLAKDFLSALMQCSNLQECKVTVDTRISHADLSIDSVSHVHLRSLRIYAMPYPFIHMCDCLVLPALSNLCFTAMLDDAASMEFDRFITRSSSTLMRLDLALTSLPCSWLLRLLQLSPQLQELMLRGPSSSSFTLEALIRLTVGDPRNADHGVLLPQLRLFGLDTPQDVYARQHIYDHGVLADMIESRWRLDSLLRSDVPGPIARLQSVVLPFSTTTDLEGMNVDSDSVSRLESFRLEGLEFLDSYSQSWSM